MKTGRSQRYSLLPFDSFGLMVTFRCDGACQFCAYHAGGQWDGFMPLKKAQAILDGVREMWEREGIDGTVPNDVWYKRRYSNKRAGVHVTGGEPFVDFERSLEIVRLVVKSGIHLQFLQTNGRWLSNEGIARRRFLRLKEAGAKGIYFSRTPFHAEFVPNRNIRLGIKVGEEVFGRGSVHVRERRMLDLLAAVGPEDEPVPLYRFIEHYGIAGFRSIMLKQYGLTLHGRAAKTVAFIFPRVSLERLMREDCSTELLRSRHTHITPDGGYIPFSCAGLLLGNPGRDVCGFIDRFDIDRFPVVKALCSENGMGELLKIGRRYGFRPDQRGYAKKCVLCLAVREHLFHAAPQEFPELGPQEFYTVKDTPVDPRVLDVVERLGKKRR